MLTLVHELVEALLCRSMGITGAQVDDFDMLHRGEGEPGEDPSAPYHWQHMAAEAVERALADQIAVNWEHYVGKQI